MERPDERAEEDSTRAETLRTRADQHLVSERLKQDVAFERDRVRRLARDIAETETSLVDTLGEMADNAERAGRTEAAERLRGKADAAQRAADHERAEAAKEPALPRPPVDDWQDAEHQRDVARGKREEAARRRDEAARLRDEAAAERDRLAVDRAVAAGARDVAAEDRAAEEAHWARQVAAASGDAVGEAREQQLAVDEEVRATYQAFTANHLRHAAADRAAADADRAEARRDRQAAAEDRKAARDDRQQAGHEAATVAAEREQSEVDRASRE